TVKYWKLIGCIFFVLFFYMSSYLPLIWDGYLAAYQLIDLTGLRTIRDALICILHYQLVLYVWNRTMHKRDVLRMVIHQMHHSVERVDTYSAFVFSPMDMIGFTALGSFMLVLVAGFSPQAATVIILVNTFFSMFQHSNIRTPAWLGYIVQRPEAHVLHHARGIHAYNYGDITIYDMLFGTWKNPRNFDYENGFYMGASSRISDMLAFKDVSTEAVSSTS